MPHEGGDGVGPRELGRGAATVGGTGGRRGVYIEVHGTVQGVGFRPFVYRVASGLGLDGDVRNAGGSVVIRAVGGGGALVRFVAMLRGEAPPHARISRIDVFPLRGASQVQQGFAVVESTRRRASIPEMPPDLATCPECVRELFDPEGRRYRYPFLNCTSCGPRATIIADLPYDRAATAMREFPLCLSCAAEYHDPADRRFHAEPIACPDCGPRLAWRPTGSAEDTADGEQAMASAVKVLASGGIAAVKGVGGYQLVCDATDGTAVARLREAKYRPAKPLAVMVGDLDVARELARIEDSGGAEVELLRSAAAPVVLLPRSPDSPLAAAVAPGIPDVGLFLPYTPLHHLLLADLGRPLVVTSGNISGESIVIDDAEAADKLGPIADGILRHNRPIWSRYDDSVVRLVRGRQSTLRRARGYAPTPAALPKATPEPLLALGAQLKHTTTLAFGSTAVLGPHTGDLEDPAALDAFERTAADLSRMHGVQPSLCAHDLHPAYLSTQYAARWPADRRVGVQHHHAHVAATAAEHGVSEQFIGIALDGLGMGDDGTLWGGEVLLASYRGFRRIGRFGTAAMPGGAAAVRRPARMALGYLFAAEDLEPGREGPAEAADAMDVELAADLLSRMESREVTAIRRMIRGGVNCPRASSAGRLFDAMAALLGICDVNSYEGEAAARLEAAARPYPDGAALAWRLRRRDAMWVYDPMPTLRDALRAAAYAPAGEVAARFHRTITEVVVALAERAAAESGSRVVCLGGGVFQNARLAAGAMEGLASAGLKPYIGERIPVNDGGISYGQAVVAAARLSGRR